MTDGPYLYDNVFKTIGQLIGKLRITRHRNLAWLITGLHLARHVHLSKIASWRPGRAVLGSKIRQLRRFLANEAIVPWKLYRPIARLLLESAGSNGQIRLLADSLKLSGRRGILMVALAYRRRALPLTWLVERRQGCTSIEQQKKLLGRLVDLIPEEREVIFIGDGEFGHTKLMVWLDEQGWDFRLRIANDTYLWLPDGTCKPVGELALKRAYPRYLPPAYISKQIPYHPVYVAIYWHKDENRPWYVASSSPTEYGIIRDYSRRMWIEELFGDLQGGGFQLQRSRVYKPDRLSRLLLALCWVYVWLMHVGGWVIKCGQRHLVDRTDRRDRSLVEIGRYWIRRRRASRKPLRMGFSPTY